MAPQSGSRIEEQDELCKACSAVEFFPLFTGPRITQDIKRAGSKESLPVPIGTLADVKANSLCPFCRLIKHTLYYEDRKYPWEGYQMVEINPSKIRIEVLPVRADRLEEMKFEDEKTRDMVATVLQPILRPSTDLSEYEQEVVRHHYRDRVIQLLSPDSIDPARPLLNGYGTTTSENSLTLLRAWIDTCVNSHGELCHPGRTEGPVSEYGLRVIDVKNRVVKDLDPAGVPTYAALSYVWGEYPARFITLREHFIGKSSACYPKLHKFAIVSSTLFGSKLSVSMACP
jgi:hypothetical protein